MEIYSNSDLRRWGQLLATRISLALPRRRAFMLALYPKMAFPDFMTNFSRLFMESCCRFCGEIRSECDLWIDGTTNGEKRRRSFRFQTLTRREDTVVSINDRPVDHSSANDFLLRRQASGVMTIPASWTPWFRLISATVGQRVVTFMLRCDRCVSRFVAK
jgi:hypothetical protein